MTMLAPQPRYRQLAQTLINEIEVANIGGRSSADEFKVRTVRREPLSNAR